MLALPSLPDKDCLAYLETFPHDLLYTHDPLKKPKPWDLGNLVERIGGAFFHKIFKKDKIFIHPRTPSGKIPDLLLKIGNARYAVDFTIDQKSPSEKVWKYGHYYNTLVVLAGTMAQYPLQYGDPEKVGNEKRGFCLGFVNLANILEMTKTHEGIFWAKRLRYFDNLVVKARLELEHETGQSYFDWIDESPKTLQVNALERFRELEGLERQAQPIYQSLPKLHGLNTSQIAKSHIPLFNYLTS